MITLEKIADQANVSVSTVSKALSGHKAISQKTKDRIVKSLTNSVIPRTPTPKVW